MPAADSLGKAGSAADANDRPSKVAAVVLVAVLAASVGVAEVVLAFEWGPAVVPTRLAGAWSDVTVSARTLTFANGTAVVFYVVSAKLSVSGGTSLDPRDVVLSISGPNSSTPIVGPKGPIAVASYVESFGWNQQPLWTGTVPWPNSTSKAIWSGYGTDFVDPNGAEVGGLDQSGSIETALDSGATMTMSFPYGHGMAASPVGFTIELSETGRNGTVALVIH